MKRLTWVIKMADKQIIATANSVKDRLRNAGQQVHDSDPTKRTVGAMVGTLNKYLGGDDMRKVVLAWLFAPDHKILEPLSSKKLSYGQAWALIKWVNWWQDEEETWHVGDTFPHEALCVLNGALQAYNMASRKEKRAASKQATFSLAATMADKGGVVTDVSAEIDELEKALENLSKIDKKRKGGE
jgi:hypothetical protein